MEGFPQHLANTAILVFSLCIGVHQSTTNITYQVTNSKSTQHQNGNIDLPLKSKTFYDYQTHVIAYKDLIESKCYIERMQLDGSHRNFSGQTEPEIVLRTRIQPPDIKLSKRKAYTLAGARVVEFCKGFPTYLLQQYSPNNNVLDYYGFANDINEIDQIRFKRQIQNYFVGRSHGQTQSQYMQFGNGNSPGKAEAEASFGSSKAVVTGSSGMGQAQSQSSPYGCDGCFNQDQGLQLNRGPGGQIREPVGPPGYKPGSQQVGTYFIPPGYKPSGHVENEGRKPLTYTPGEHALLPGSEGNIPPGYIPGPHIPTHGWDGRIPPGYKPEISQPSEPSNIPLGHRPGGTVTSPGSDGGLYTGYKPGEYLSRPEDKIPSGPPTGYKPENQFPYPRSEGNTQSPDYKPGGLVTPTKGENGYPSEYKPNIPTSQSNHKGEPSMGFRPEGTFESPGSKVNLQNKIPGSYKPSSEIPPGYRPGHATYPSDNVLYPGGPSTYPGQAPYPRGKAPIPEGKVTSSGDKSPYPTGQTPPPEDQSSYPGGQPTYPGGQTTYPGGQTNYPGGQTTYPGGQTTYPEGQTNYPGGQPTYPGGQTAYPGGQTTYPGGQTAYPGGQTAYPGSQTTYPGDKIRYPIDSSAQPTRQPTYPAGQIPYPGKWPSYPGNDGTYPGAQSTLPGGQAIYGLHPPYAREPTTYPGTSYPAGQTYPDTQIYHPGGQIAHPTGQPTPIRPNTYSREPTQPDNHSLHPGGQTTFPGGQTAYPGGHTTYPGVQTTYPGEQTTYHGGKTTHPEEPRKYPGGQTTYPVGPGVQTSLPGEPPIYTSNIGGQVTYPKGQSTYPGQQTIYPEITHPTYGKQGYGPGHFGGQFAGDYHSPIDEGKFSGSFSGQYQPNGHQSPDSSYHQAHNYPQQGRFTGSFFGQYGQGYTPDFHKPGSWGGPTSGKTDDSQGPAQYGNENDIKQPTQTNPYKDVPYYTNRDNPVTNQNHNIDTQPSYEINGKFQPPTSTHTNTPHTNNEPFPQYSGKQPSPTENPEADKNYFQPGNKPGNEDTTNNSSFGVKQPGHEIVPGNFHTGNWPSDTQQEDDAFSQVQTSVQDVNNETQASANAQGRFLGGNAHSQVSGTYSGSGSFSASAGSNDGKRGALTQVSGGKKGAISSAQGLGGRSQSQAQVQYSSETGDTGANAQTNGINQGTNTQVQGGTKGGLADAQANGPGSTSSQAQIGFVPQDEYHVIIAPRRGGTANSQSGSHSGQSQVQVQGQFQHGIQYSGSAQAGSGKKLVPRNQSQFESLSYSFPSFKPLVFNSPADQYTSQPDSNLNSSALSNKSPQIKEKMQKPQNSYLEVTTVPPTEEKEENNTEEYEEYEEEETPGSDTKRHTISQATRSQKQHIILDPLEEIDAFVTQVQGDPDLKDGMVLQPGQAIPGTYGYQVPQGFRGVVKAVSSVPYTSAIGADSQAQTISLTPGKGQIMYRSPTYAVSSRTGTKNGHYSYGSGYTYQPATPNHLRAGVNNPTFISSSMSETGYQNPKTGKRIPSVYYSQSSTCGYFTNTCIFNGSNKICFPKQKKHSDAGC